jgi:hypothetical protein
MSNKRKRRQAEKEVGNRNRTDVEDILNKVFKMFGNE